MPQAPPMLLLCGVLSIVYVRVQRLFKTTATALKRIEGILLTHTHTHTHTQTHTHTHTQTHTHTHTHTHTNEFVYVYIHIYTYQAH